jgi:hypothetical protein
MNAQIPEFTYIRQVVGAFQISMPVTNKAIMLWPEEIPVLKWRLQAMKAYQPLVSCASPLPRPGDGSGRWTWR